MPFFNPNQPIPYSTSNPNFTPIINVITNFSEDNQTEDEFERVTFNIESNLPNTTFNWEITGLNVSDVVGVDPLNGTVTTDGSGNASRTRKLQSKYSNTSASANVVFSLKNRSANTELASNSCQLVAAQGVSYDLGLISGTQELFDVTDYGNTNYDFHYISLSIGGGGGQDSPNYYLDLTDYGDSTNTFEYHLAGGGGAGRLSTVSGYNGGGGAGDFISGNISVSTMNTANLNIYVGQGGGAGSSFSRPGTPSNLTLPLTSGNSFIEAIGGGGSGQWDIATSTSAQGGAGYASGGGGAGNVAGGAGTVGKGNDGGDGALAGGGVGYRAGGGGKGAAASDCTVGDTAGGLGEQLGDGWWLAHIRGGSGNASTLSNHRICSGGHGNTSLPRANVLALGQGGDSGQVGKRGVVGFKFNRSRRYFTL